MARARSAILGHVDRVVFRLQSLAHKTGERRIVFGQSEFS